VCELQGGDGLCPDTRRSEIVAPDAQDRDLLETFVQEQNIQLYEKLLAQETPGSPEPLIIVRLLADEQARWLISDSEPGQAG
jgi:hypothetical protein